MSPLFCEAWLLPEPNLQIEEKEFYHLALIQVCVRVRVCVTFAKTDYLKTEWSCHLMPDLIDS